MLSRPGRERKTTFLARVTETVSYKINFHGHSGIIAGTRKEREKEKGERKDGIVGRFRIGLRERYCKPGLNHKEELMFNGTC